VTEFTSYALLSVAVATALFHTLIPDHWLPFVLIGKARGWRVGTTVAVSGVSALIHVALSVLLALLALGLGVTAARAIGESLEQAGAVLLVVFGVGYALWAWRKGGHFHPGGARVHAGEQRLACDGREGDTNPEHLHYHADEQLIAARAGRNAWWLAFIVGVNPCVLILPIIMTAAGQGAGAVAIVCVAYAVPSVILMVGLSAIGVAGGRKIKVPLVARYMELTSGMLIAALGLVVLVLENH
jgi:ABC-type nickel/cobalt efflux system permease component RcnA